MEPGVGPPSSMDPLDPSSIGGPSASPSLLNNSLLGGLSQGGGLERGDGEGDSGLPRGLLPRIEPYGNSQRKPRSSAFPSSLTWDSDSEKEIFDEEELQHFSNPHGLAAHSPGSPTCGQEQDRVDCVVYQTTETSKNLFFERELASPLERRDQGRDETYGEPRIAQSSTTQLEKDKAGSVSDQAGSLFSDTKPKEGCQKREEEIKKFDQRKEEVRKVPERDVYTFPGDSDPESPPPGPWAHCTFIQRRRKKRALLRPFSGLNPWQRTTATSRKTRLTPARAKGRAKMVNDEAGVFEFKEEEEEKVQEREMPQGLRGELCQEIFTCVECSIYFKRRAHLREHMREHAPDGGRKGQRGEEGAGRRRAKKTGFECMECGQEFSDRLVLVDHHRRHQESRRKILEEIGKLNDGGKGTEVQTSRRKPKRPTVKEPSTVCGQFVCLKCNYSSDVPQELAEHAKTHTTRAKAGVPRASPRFQQKSRKKGQTRLSGNVVSSPATTLPNERYPTRASVQATEKHPEVDRSQPNACDPQAENEGDPFPGSSQDHTVSATPAEPVDEPEVASAQTDAPSPVGQCLQEESGTTQVGLAEENFQKPQTPAPVPSNAKAPRRRDVAFKSTGKRRSKRVVRDSMGRTRGSSRQDPQLTDTNDAKNQNQNTEQATEEDQKEASPLPEPEAEPNLVIKIDPLEAPALALQLKRSFSASLRGATERLDLAEGQQAQLRHKLPLVLINALSSDLQTPLSYNRVMGEESSTVSSDLKPSPPPKTSEEPKDQRNEEALPGNREDKCGQDITDAKDDDHADDEDNDDDLDEVEEQAVFNRLLEALTEEEDEEDEEGVSLKSVGRKCPYCPDRFDNGIGLANHIRGHLNRVGVSYNVRHFISPEEVNAIEKKFSYQKKKKKGKIQNYALQGGLQDWSCSSVSFSDTVLDALLPVANFDPATFSVMRCEFCSAGFDTRAGLSSHARAHLRDFGITNWEVTVSPINVLRELFSKRPDLALSTPPSFTSDVQKQDPDKEKEEPVSGQDEEGGTSEAAPQAPESPTPPWKEEHNDSEPEGGEDKEEVVKMPLLDNFSSSPGSKSPFLQPENVVPVEETESKSSSLLKCEVCSAPFETRRGLSSHARSHLRQLGVGVSESSGAPIDLLYQITKERATDAQPPVTPLSRPPAPSPKKTPSPVPTPSPRRDAEFEEESQDIKPPLPLSVLGSVVKVPPSPTSPSPCGSVPSSPFGKSRSPSPSPVLRKAPISSLLPVSSPLRSQEHKSMCRVQSAALSTPPRPFWAPQDTDAPLNLTMEADPSKDIICKLCGAWFETRKGLSSHARAHLRHFGVEYSESKGSPIDLLNRLILTDDFKHRANSLLPDSPEDLRVRSSGVAPASPSTSTSSASKRPLLPSSLLFKTSALGSGVGPKATSSSSSSSTTHSLLAPPTKKLKPSPQQVFRLNSRELMPISLAEPLKDVGCEFCGELFENRKGLSSHARSHLRQLGITEWSVNGSPIDTLRELIARRGLPCVMPVKPLKSPSSSPGPGPPRTSLQSSSPPGSVLGRLTFPFTHQSSQHQPAGRKLPVSASATNSSSAVVMVKPKPEPEQVEVTVTEEEVEGCEAYGSEPQHSSWSSTDNVHPVNLVMPQEREPSRDIRCEFCGEFFENRKGLSSHARSHLRHMGITEWSVNGSPIDTLWDIMRKQGTTPASVVLGVKEEPGQDSSPPWNSQSYQSPKVSRKSPLNLLHSGSRLHKHGLGATGLSTTPPAGKFFGMAPLGKRVLASEGPLGGRSPAAQSKTFSPPPQDFSFKAKVSTDKHGVGHMDASCELCGFFFENRKALASHARAHLRQFGVTEWCVNGSPIETLSAWMRSRPQTVAEIHRSYLQGGRNAQKKRSSSSLSPSSDSDPMTHVSQKPSPGQWASLTLSHGRTVRRDAMKTSWRSSSQAVDVKNGSGASSRHVVSTQSEGHQSNSTLPRAQVARSELNVRVPRGIERRPLKHPSHADGGERESCPPKPPRTSTVPALVPKPPSTPLVKLVGKIYSLKCRFCDVEFHGPLSVQEDWIRHLQQHILNLNYNKPVPTANSTPAKSDTAAPRTQASATTSTATTTSTALTTTSTITLNPTPIPTPASTPTPAPTPTPTSTAPPVASLGTPATAEPVLTPAT